MIDGLLSFFQTMSAISVSLFEFFSDSENYFRIFTPAEINDKSCQKPV